MFSRRSYVFWFFMFWLLCMALYRDVLGAQFTDDFFAFAMRMEGEGWGGFWHSFTFNSLYYFSNFVFMATYSLFGYHPWPWFLLFTGLHALNAVLAMAFIRRLFLVNGLARQAVAPVLMALLFLLSPYQTENIVWGGTLNYALCLCCMWVCLMLYADYLTKGLYIRLVLFYVVYLLSLISLGLSLVYPGVFLAVFLFLWPSSGWGSRIMHLIRIGLPCAVLIGLYFFANHSLKGDFITHYGSEQHLDLDFAGMLSTLWSYLAKLWGNVHFWPGNGRFKVYEFLAKGKVYWGLTVLAVLALLVWYRANRRQAVFVFGWVVVIILLLLPVLNMYFMYLHVGENDRLSYAPSVFIYGLPVVVAVLLADKWVVWLAIVAFMGGNVLLLDKHAPKWKHAAAIQDTAVDSPLFYAPGEVYLLNVPNYYQGIYVYRSMSYFHWKRAYQFGLPDLSQKLKVVSYANMHSVNDSVTVTPLDSANSFKVELSAWGNWFSVNDLGNDMEISVDEWNHSYQLKAPHLTPDDRLLYFTPSGWQEVVLH